MRSSSWLATFTSARSSALNSYLATGWPKRELDRRRRFGSPAFALNRIGALGRLRPLMDRVLLLAIVLCLRFGGPSAHAAPGGARSIQAVGQNYLPLKNWADRWQLDFSGLRKNEEIHATNKATTLAFKLNSQ